MALLDKWRAASRCLKSAAILYLIGVATIDQVLPAAGAPTGQVAVWTASDMKAIAGKLQSTAAKDKIAGETLGSYENGSCSLWVRTQSGQAELHKVKTDLIVVEQGDAILVTGGVIPDAKTTAPNEVRGSLIQGGVSRHVAPGDVIRIAAGTPHQFQLEPGKTFSYLALKLPGRSSGK